MSNPIRKTAFFVSDGTAITAETVGHSLLAQFPGLHIRQVRFPFVDSIDKAIACKRQIDEAAQRDGSRPVVFSTLVQSDIVDTLQQANAKFLDLFETFIEPLEKELDIKSTHTVGRFHGMTDSQAYKSRIEAINFTLAHDDGQTDEKLDEAEVILVGVSRSGKTPTSLYLAMQFGVKAANYPLIPEDFERNKLPGVLHKHHKKLFGLTIKPERLSQVRNERRPNSKYASFENCRNEIDAAQRIMKRENIPFVESTSRSIEEISALVMQKIGIPIAYY